MLEKVSYSNFHFRRKCLFCWKIKKDRSWTSKYPPNCTGLLRFDRMFGSHNHVLLLCLQFVLEFSCSRVYFSHVTYFLWSSTRRWYYIWAALKLSLDIIFQLLLDSFIPPLVSTSSVMIHHVPLIWSWIRIFDFFLLTSFFVFPLN